MKTSTRPANAMQVHNARACRRKRKGVTWWKLEHAGEMSHLGL